MHFYRYMKTTFVKCKEFHVWILDPKTKLGGLNDAEHSNSKPEFYFPCYGNYYRSYSNSRNPPHYIRSWEDTLNRTSHAIGSFISTLEQHVRAILSTGEKTASDTVSAISSEFLLRPNELRTILGEHQFRTVLEIFLWTLLMIHYMMGQYPN